MDRWDHALSDYTTIDTKMHGRPGITGAFVVRGEKTALIETGPKSCLDHVLAGLQEAGIEHLDYILVTHIHLDHAGGAGTLAARFPDAVVCVHEVGARHLVDPSKLWSSAGRIYGDAMESMWGGIDPIAKERLRTLTDGDEVDLGGRKLRAVETLGHAGHHHSFVDDGSGTMFTGDAMGIRLPEIAVFRPATPPPEFNLEMAVSSIERIRAERPSSLCLTHFGGIDQGRDPIDVDRACDEAIDALKTWEEWVTEGRAKTRDLDEVTEHVRERSQIALQDRIDENDADRMEQTTSFWMNTWGYMRYMDKRDQAASS